MAEYEKQDYQRSIPEATVGGSGLGDIAATTSRDALGFKPYVDAVFSFLHNKLTKAPFSMSVEGEWGAGKSSFMGQLQEALDSGGEITINFNLWRHDKAESMWSHFAVEFVEKLSNKKRWYFRGFAYVRLYFKGFNWIKGLPSLVLKVLLGVSYIYLVYVLYSLVKNPEHFYLILSALSGEDHILHDFQSLLTVVGWGGVIVLCVFFIKKAVEVLGNPLSIDLKKFNNSPNYSENAAFIEAFHKDIDKTIDILVGKRDKVFVFVDDLDRAEIHKVAELMHGVNLMISNSNKLIFVIGMDRERVAAGIAGKHKDLLGFILPNEDTNSARRFRNALSFGYTFLEKFLQLTFRIPTPSKASIKRFLKSLGNPITSEQGETSKVSPSFRLSIGEDSEEFRQTVELVAPYLNNNPRRIKQFINAFRLKAHIAYNTGLFEHDPNLRLGNLGKFVAATLIWPQIINDLQKYPQLIRELATSDPEYFIEDQMSPIGKKWYEAELLGLLSATTGDERASDYDMENVDIEALIRTSPTVSFQGNFGDDFSR